MIFFNKLINWWRLRQNFVIADGADNSVTFSQQLFRHIRRAAGDDTSPKVFVFFIPDTQHYGFTIDPQLEQDTQLADIQYNSKHRCLGFESLNPTVQRILYDYGVNVVDRPVKLSVSVHTTNSLTYYQIEKPHEKFTRHHSSL
jgi:hypothetical protein